MGVGGGKLDYFFDAGSPTTHLFKTKVLLKSMIYDADKGARFMNCDFKDFFLATPMADPECMRLHTKHIPADIIKRYNVQPLIHNDYVYCKI